MKISLCRVLVAALVLNAAVVSAAKTASEAKVRPEICYECHETVAELHKMGRHLKVNCVECHQGLAKHLEDPSEANRPVTDLSWQACGACHADQYGSFLQTSRHRPARDEKSQLTGRSPNPFWDKLMMGHGFTKEHAATRSHSWMLADHLLVDRAYGGRFQPRSGWTYVAAPSETPLWDLIADKYPGDDEQKTFMPQTAAAANPVCLQCKTQDTILDWPYLGEPQSKALWTRQSKVVDLARTVRHALNCFICHDPHAAKPRIVRDALIQAMTRSEADTLWHKDRNRTAITVHDMGERGFNRKIALLGGYDSRLLCGQCHVEYNCNPGLDVHVNQPVKMADSRTNHFPFKDVLDLYDHYVEGIGFLDFKHALTGGYLWKAQHPEAETFYNSTMAKAGVGCDDCHMPKVKSAPWGKTATSHFALTPRLRLKETCLRCHASWSDSDALQAIDSIKAYTRGRMRKAEFWLSALIDKLVEAGRAGIDADTIKKGREQHLKAHILWEWWTAENSDGFHNPSLARESLTRSMDEALKGIKLLSEAIEAGAAK